MAYRKFDTCFFERYAQLTLQTVLDPNYDQLINVDRPDLQTPDGRIGIEVTRAMDESKKAANNLLKELAGMNIREEDRSDLQQIIDSGYGYGLPGHNYMGNLEYEYWSLAQPLQRILTSKIEKIGKGFYGKFDHFGLFVFCRDLLNITQVEASVNYCLSLQDNLDLRFDTLYLSQTDTLYVCRLTDNQLYEGLHTRITVHAIPDHLRREFFFKALGYVSP